MNSNQNSAVLSQIKEAIDHIDRSLASDILRKIQKGELSDPSVTKFKRQLQIVNFPNLSDQEAFDVIKSNLIGFMQLDIPLEDSIFARYFFQGEDQKNVQRANLKRAILENAEKLGNLTISEWLRTYEQAVPEEDRTDQSILTFLINNDNARKLNNAERNALKKIIHAYIASLSEQLIDIFDLVDAQRRIKMRGIPKELVTPAAPYVEYGQKRAASTPISQPAQRPATPPRMPSREPVRETKREAIISRIPFKVAVQKNPAIYEQLISSTPINVSGAPSPLRPTIKNWIRDYYDIIGTGKHTSIERSKYLYTNINARRLSEQERSALLEIIKSLEENTPLNVDITNQQILFSKQPEMAPPQERIVPPAPPAISQNAPMPPKVSQNAPITTPVNSRISRSSGSAMELGSNFHEENGEHLDTSNITGIKFDAPHKFPEEK